MIGLHAVSNDESLKLLPYHPQSEYEVWTCSGEGGREPVFFGPGRFRREENSVTLLSSLQEKPSQILLKVSDAD